MCKHIDSLLGSAFVQVCCQLTKAAVITSIVYAVDQQTKTVAVETVGKVSGVCTACCNRFNMIQSQQLSSSFKLIISFTFHFKFNAQDVRCRKTLQVVSSFS